MLGPLRIARVTGGLCGGMALDAVRRWRSGLPPAEPTRRDMSKVFGAQLRSFHLPSAPLRYLALQRPGATRQRSLACEETRRQVRERLLAGEPALVALVCALGHSPLLLTAHHVVLAYDLVQHDENGSTFAVYDPNYAAADDVLLRLSASGNAHSRGRTVHAAFVLDVR